MPAQPRGADTRAVLDEIGLPCAEIDELVSSGAAIVKQQ